MPNSLMASACNNSTQDLRTNIKMFSLNLMWHLLCSFQKVCRYFKKTTIFDSFKNQNITFATESRIEALHNLCFYLKIQQKSYWNRLIQKSQILSCYCRYSNQSNLCRLLIDRQMHILHIKSKLQLTHQIQTIVDTKFLNAGNLLAFIFRYQEFQKFLPPQK